MSTQIITAIINKTDQVSNNLFRNVMFDNINGVAMKYNIFAG